MCLRSRLQMVEQFEERVEDRLDDMEAKLLGVSEQSAHVAGLVEAERMSNVKQQVPSHMPPSSQAVSNSVL
jgi:hypothetical protein